MTTKYWNMRHKIYLCTPTSPSDSIVNQSLHMLATVGIRASFQHLELHFNMYLQQIRKLALHMLFYWWDNAAHQKHRGMDWPQLRQLYSSHLVKHNI